MGGGPARLAAARLPLAASLALHGCVLAVLIGLTERLPPVEVSAPIPPAGIEIMLGPPDTVAAATPPPPEPPPIAEAEPPPPVAEPDPPPPEPTPVAEAQPPPPPPPPEPPPPPPPEPPPPPKPPPPRPKPAVKPAPAPPRPALPPVVPTPLFVPIPAPASPAAVPRQAAPPPTPTGPVVSANYRALLSAWLERNKRYPESARARGEEGRAVLRFRIERSGRVLNYAIIQSTGYPDLDAAIDQMMRGATLPPFPPDMTASDVEVSVGIRFAIAR